MILVLGTETNPRKGSVGFALVEESSAVAGESRLSAASLFSSAASWKTESFRPALKMLFLLGTWERSQSLSPLGLDLS